MSKHDLTIGLYTLTITEDPDGRSFRAALHRKDEIPDEERELWIGESNVMTAAVESAIKAWVKWQELTTQGLLDEL